MRKRRRSVKTNQGPTKFGKVAGEITSNITKLNNLKTLPGKMGGELGDAAIKFSNAAVNYGNAAQARAQGAFLRKQGKALLINAKANRKLAKAKVVEARQGAAKWRAVSGGAVGVSGNIAAGVSQKNQNSALLEWMKGINSQSQPAEGTGDASSGNPTGEKTTGSESYPTGNYRLKG